MLPPSLHVWCNGPESLETNNQVNLKTSYTGPFGNKTKMSQLKHMMKLFFFVQTSASEQSQNNEKLTDGKKSTIQSDLGTEENKLQ